VWALGELGAHEVLAGHRDADPFVADELTWARRRDPGTEPTPRTPPPPGSGHR
jgi:hypothetical protein